MYVQISVRRDYRKILYGFNIPLGSKICFKCCMSWTVFGSFIIFKYFAFKKPIPCSELMLPFICFTLWKMYGSMRVKTSGSKFLVDICKCRFPSPKNFDFDVCFRINSASNSYPDARIRKLYGHDLPRVLSFRPPNGSNFQAEEWSRNRIRNRPF